MKRLLVLCLLGIGMTGCGKSYAPFETFAFKESRNLGYSVGRDAAGNYEVILFCEGRENMVVARSASRDLPKAIRLAEDTAQEAGALQCSPFKSGGPQ